MFRTKSSGVATAGSGIVMPGQPGHMPLEEKAQIVIEGRDASGLLACRYPGHFLRHHQVASVEELLAKVTAQIRARHGRDTIEFLKVPASLDAGGVIEIRSR